MRSTASALRRDWFSKTLAGILPGFTLGLLASAFYVQLAAPVPLAATAQLAMWLVVPVWSAVLSLCFLFPSGVSAWGWLCGANAVGVAALLLRQGT